MGVKKIGNIILIQLSDVDSNIYVIGDTVIDSGTGMNFTRLYTTMKAFRIDPKAIRQVINTHGHFDHVGGNGYFINAKISIHEKDADIIEKGMPARLPSPTCIAVPTMALAMPPPVSPTGLGIFVKKSQLI